MATPINLGFARIGAKRELKKATEAYWSGKLAAEELLATGRDSRKQNWAWQAEAGIPEVPCGDFSFYDHVLDTAWMFDVVPRRFRDLQLSNDLDLYFAMARGVAGQGATQALEMTKWFDTNYHYLVPEFASDEEFCLERNPVVEHLGEAKAAGLMARPVILGPISFLLLGKMKQSSAHPLSLLNNLLPAYEDLLRSFVDAGAHFVQIDEPILATDLDEEVRTAFGKVFEQLAGAASLKILLATYFGDLGENLNSTLRLPIHALHLDIVRGPQQLEVACATAPKSLKLSLGLINGRNIWKTDLTHALELAEKAAERLSDDRLMIGPSCSLLHVPVDLASEEGLDAEIREWLAFGRQKLIEVTTITRGLNEGREAIRTQLEENRESLEKRQRSRLVHKPAVEERLKSTQKDEFSRSLPFAARKPLQQTALRLPPLPTTTIGSFPQTDDLRRQRARMRKKEISVTQYEGFLREDITHCIREQEKLGFDVLVHGEAERNDMVEYFGELLQGFAFTENGWVQSYGSRCVKPPIIYGDIVRDLPMTVNWWRFAQSLTDLPVKGMLTGPVTVLQWSFVRDDQPRRDTCFQLALAIRDEALDLEAAGCRVIQLDEPALREGLPFHRRDQAEYLRWAVDAFRLATAAVQDTTQIHTHMCYAEFNDIVESIKALDADVISMESARSQMDLLEPFAAFGYQNDIGPGVYDIHSPRVPPVDEIVHLLEKALLSLPKEQLWVNPDCGLKTRKWEEVRLALDHLVKAAQQVRSA